jgi:hypothetical protein
VAAHERDLPALPDEQGDTPPERLKESVESTERRTSRPLSWTTCLPKASQNAFGAWACRLRFRCRMKNAIRFVKTRGLVVAVVAAALWTDSGARAASELLWVEACAGDPDDCPNAPPGCAEIAAGDIGAKKTMFIGAWGTTKWETADGYTTDKYGELTNSLFCVGLCNATFSFYSCDPSKFDCADWKGPAHPSPYVSSEASVVYVPCH